jgi:uncharacterized protein (TIGR02265 family)
MPSASEWEVDFERRIALATPRDTLLGMFFTTQVETVRQLRGEEAARRCQEACAEQRFVPFFNYPVSAYLRLLRLAAGLLESQAGSYDEALRQLGRRATQQFADSPVGKIGQAVAKKNPRLLLNSIPDAYRVSAHFGKRTVEWTGPTSGRLVARGDFLPGIYQEGMVQLALDMAQVQDRRVEARQFATLELEIAFSWAGG